MYWQLFYLFVGTVTLFAAVKTQKPTAGVPEVGFVARIFKL